MTTRAEIKKWLDDGVKRNCAHVVVLCDPFDHDDYPAYFFAYENVRRYVENCEKARSANAMAPRVVEVYWLGGTPEQLEQQLDMHRARVYGPDDLPAKE